MSRVHKVSIGKRGRNHTAFVHHRVPPHSETPQPRRGTLQIASVSHIVNRKRFKKQLFQTIGLLAESACHEVESGECAGRDAGQLVDPVTLHTRKRHVNQTDLCDVQ